MARPIHGLSPEAQLVVSALDMIYDETGSGHFINLVEVAQQTGLNITHIDQVIELLRAAGYVEPYPSHDAVELTPRFISRIPNSQGE